MTVAKTKKKRAKKTAKKKRSSKKKPVKKTYTMAVVPEEPKAESAAEAVAKLAVTQTVVDLQPGQPVPIHLWGKDHWSTFGYAECRLVDNKGSINIQHMRGNHCGDDAGHPTRLTGGNTLSDHGDFDCLFDAEDAGLVMLKGTGLNPVIHKLTTKGALVAAALRTHKAEGGSFSTFSFPA
jgi:hypothetical protein